MKKSIFILAFIILGSGIVLTSCSNPEQKLEDSRENVDEAQKDLDQAKEDYKEEYLKFMEESNAKIIANEQLIADLREYSEDKNKEVKADYDKSISELEARNQELKSKWDARKEANRENWESFKKEFNHDMEELGKSIKDLGKDNVK